MDKELKSLIPNLSRQSFFQLLEELAQEKTDQANQASQQAIRIRCKDDFQTFCDLFFPHYTKYSWNQFHLDCFELYQEPGRDLKTVDCAPRGYAKSTIKALFKPLHDICYQLERYIVFFSATKSQAVQKLKDIRAEILSNDLLSSIYGIHFPNRRAGSEEFEVNMPTDTIKLQALGAGTEARGIRYGESRPTKILLDDVEDSEEVLSDVQRDKTLDWFRDVVTNLGSNGTNIEIVGTVLHRESLLMTLKRNPIYNTKVYKAVLSWADRQDLWKQWEDIVTDIDNENRLEDAKKFYLERESEMLKGTKVLWPEKEPYYDLMLEVIDKGKRSFMKEKQNMPMPSSDAIFDNIWFYRDAVENGVEGFKIEKNGVFIPKESMISSYGTIDPATGKTSAMNKGKLDFTSIVSGYKCPKGRLFVQMDWTKRAKPSEYISQIFEHNELMKYDQFGVEENLYRGLLVENIIREKRRLERRRRIEGRDSWGIKVPFYEILNREKKTERIFTLEPKVNNGWILFNRTLSMEFMDQVQQFPSKEVHDDAPDALEMLWGMVNKRYKPSPINLEAIGSR